MEHKILKHNEEECFIELINNDFRTKIEFNFNPNENFKGLAVCCRETPKHTLTEQICRKPTFMLFFHP
jgi:hypothetical protein